MNIQVMVLCWLAVAVDVPVADAYTAAVWPGGGGGGAGGGCDNIAGCEPLSALRALSAEKADIMVLPSADTEPARYDEVVRGLARAARHAALYLVAPLRLRTGPQRGGPQREGPQREGPPADERTTLVFDRQGAILAVSRKPTCSSHVANDTAIPASHASPASFRTDFGVTFSLLAEEELVLGAPPAPGHVQNVVLAGACHSHIPYFNAAQFTASWAYTHRVNVVTAWGLVAGRAGPLSAETLGPLALARLDHNTDASPARARPPVSRPAGLPAHYEPGAGAVRLLARTELEAEGLSHTVCHNHFCCHFYLKTRPTDAQREAEAEAEAGAEAEAEAEAPRYALAAFEGARRFAGSTYIGAQECALFACAGRQDKRACSFGSVKNSTNLIFEKLSISANFTHENTVPYPVILSDRDIPPEHFEYVTTSNGHVKSVNMTVTDAESLLAFGAFGRVFERDYDTFSGSEDSEDLKYIFNEDVHELFDYLWIRVRIIMVIVSIYVLEMM